MRRFLLLTTFSLIASATPLTQTSTQAASAFQSLSGSYSQSNNGQNTNPSFSGGTSQVFFTLGFSDLQVVPNRAVTAASVDLTGLALNFQSLPSNSHSEGGYTYSQFHINYCNYYYCYGYYTQETGHGGSATFQVGTYVLFQSIQTASHSMLINDYGDTNGQPSTYDLILNGFGPSLEAGETLTVSGFFERYVTYQVVTAAYYGYSTDYFATSGSLASSGLLSVTSEETVPEPSTIICLGAGLILLWRRKRPN